MATRTAPDPFTVAANKVTTTLHLIDASGDLYTDAIVSDAAPTTTELQAWATAYQAATQASLYKISQESAWEGDADADNADAGYRGSVKDGINLLYKNVTTLSSETPRLIAPIAAVMQGNQDIPLVSSTELAAVITAELALLTGFSLASAQYTERRERKNNPRIKV